MNKQHLRNLLKPKRRQILDEYLAQKESYYLKLKENTVPALMRLIGNSCPSISGFYPIQSEIDCLFVMREIGHNGVFALPVTYERDMVFREWNFGPLVKGKFGIMVPPEENTIVYPDIVITPLLGYTRSKHRLGYGTGYYDSYFAKHQCLKIGLCFTEQLIDDFDTLESDVPLDFIITEDGLVA